MLKNRPGVEDVGFVQPNVLPELMARSGVFVLPSRKEPWGVVVQEAAAAGLPLISSDAVGASVHLLQEHYNGWLFPSGSTESLASLLRTAASADRRRLSQMGNASVEISHQFQPGRWVQTLLRGSEGLICQP